MESDLEPESAEALSFNELMMIRQKLADLEANGSFMDDFPFVPDWDCAFRAWLVRTFADSEIDPDIAIKNCEKYKKYILYGATETHETKKRSHLRPVDPETA